MTSAVTSLTITPIARSFVDELRAKAAQAAERPRSFRARDDLAPGLRSVVHGRYLIFFRELPDVVRIERVLHSARDLPALFDAGN